MTTYASAGCSSVESGDAGQMPSGAFMLTLCQFDGPVSIRPAQSPQLKRFTFFTTRAHHGGGGEHVYLHMGYFETLTDAQSLLPAVRRRFPHAIATRAPAPLPQPTPPAVADESLTDTQVMRVLESRGRTQGQIEGDQASSAQIEMLRPEDTSVRRALRQAVVQGAPVYFAVQLDWSAQPIDSSRVPALALFKTHTLYAMESRREGRSRYFLRLGFFADAASAKEAAFSVRAKFASAVVVPVTAQEHTCAHEASKDSLGLAHVCLPIYEASDRSETVSPAPETEAPVDRPRRSAENTETLEQTLETLAERESWNDPDALNETGVRHLKVKVLKRRFGGF